MPSAGFFALFDDIATLLDDVAALSKVAAQKTAGVLGDDLALNAQQVSGLQPERELPVVWAVFKGSLLNKLIIVPVALALSAFAPWALTPLLMLGGAFLCFEGFEKLAHRFLTPPKEDEAHHKALTQALQNQAIDLVAFEKEKIVGAIRTDFILSAEIVAIALWSLEHASWLTQCLVLSAVALGMTIGVYGLVACIVKFDDLGLHLTRRSPAGRPLHRLGQGILTTAPYILKTLTVLGTAAMFLVGGSIVAHGVAPLHQALAPLAHSGGWGTLALTAAHGAIGVVIGALALALVAVARRGLQAIK